MTLCVDIFADPVCPWCLIGKAELDRALESRPDHPLILRWHPFRLDPEMPAGGMAFADYMAGKFKDQPGIVAAMQPVLEAAERLGLAIDPAAITRVPATTDAHRLMHWAGIEGAQSRVMAGLLGAHWRDGRDIGDRTVLAQIADAAGMDGLMVERLLDSDADKDRIITAESHARERGVRSLPTFIVGDRYVLPGAQPASLWQQVIDELGGGGD